MKVRLQTDLPVGEYKATQEEFMIKVINGKPMVKLSSKVIDGEFNSTIITTTHWLYKYGTTKFDDRVLTTVCLFLANIYGLDIITAYKKLKDLIWESKYKDTGTTLKKDKDFPKDVPEGTLKASDFKWVKDGVEHTKRYHNFYGDIPKWKERVANNPDIPKKRVRTLKDKLLDDHIAEMSGGWVPNENGGLTLSINDVRSNNTLNSYDDEELDPWMMETDMF